MQSEFEKAALAAGVVPLKTKARIPMNSRQSTVKPLTFYQSAAIKLVARTQRQFRPTKGKCPTCLSAFQCKCNSKGLVRFSAYSLFSKSPEGCKSWV